MRKQYRKHAVLIRVRARGTKWTKVLKPTRLRDVNRATKVTALDTDKAAVVCGATWCGEEGNAPGRVRLSGSL